VSDDRARITAGELAIVCSRYDLGDVRSARHFKAGSRASPKALLVTSKGTYLLKRRAAPPADAARADWLNRIALSHQIVLHLATRGVPVPQLVGTRDDQNSMLQTGEHVYEIYRFVRGRAYDRTTESARSAGELLARCHLALRELRPDWPPPRRSYHAHPRLPSVLRDMPGLLKEPGLRETATHLADRYERAAAAANAAGLAGQADQLIHADWHPGNLLFAEEPGPAQVAAILDFDTVSLAPALTDAANGALQFALRRKPVEPPQPGRAPFSVAFDPELFAAFWQGYRGTEPQSRDWPFAAVPALCIEAIIAEAALPIAATGRFGRFSGGGVLRLANRTAAWFESHEQSLVRRATNP
jgi:homoserine kinase type II